MAIRSSTLTPVPGSQQRTTSAAQKANCTPHSCHCRILHEPRQAAKYARKMNLLGGFQSAVHTVRPQCVKERQRARWHLQQPQTVTHSFKLTKCCPTFSSPKGSSAGRPAWQVGVMTTDMVLSSWQAALQACFAREPSQDVEVMRSCCSLWTCLTGHRPAPGSNSES